MLRQCLGILWIGGAGRGLIGAGGCGVGDDGDAVGGAQAGGAGLDHGQGGLTVTDSAGGFDSHVRADGLAHELNVFDGGTAGAEASGGFDEGGTGSLGSAGGFDDFIRGEQTGFEDDFDQVAFGRRDDFVDLVFDEVPMAFFGGADVEDHVEFVRAGAKGVLGRVHFGLGKGGAEGKSDDGADLDRRAGEQFFCISNPVGVDADGKEGVFAGLGAEFFDGGAGGVRFEEGVIDQGGEVVGFHETGS